MTMHRDEKAGEVLGGSFRDPSGFLFHHDDFLYRQINKSYQANYEFFASSGLYDELLKQQLLIPHHEVDLTPAKPELAFKVIQPDPVRFISYPYEWSFSMLKDAALATLKIQQIALDFGMSLKDASAYNIQFHNGKPTLIDTLSFEKYEEGGAWVAYGQFCRHFLAPLALMSLRDIRFGLMFRTCIDGIPLDFASANLPGRTRFLNLGLATHIHLHARFERRHGADSEAAETRGKGVSLSAMRGLIVNLESTIRGLKWRPVGTEWGDYYDFTNYTDDSIGKKREIIERFLDKIKPSTVWDLGANTGAFTRIATDRGIAAVAMDIDPAAVEKNYRQVAANGEKSLLPLVMDLRNPSPGIGWANREREAFAERGPVDAVFALALIHHVVISNNVPLMVVAEYFSTLCEHLIIEFVPKEDSQVKRLLSTREDIFPDYNESGFEKAFSSTFKLVNKETIEGSLRTMYLMSKR
ncbi:MAG: class I SAM-dependent methyltransferase [bacterium]